MTELLQRLSVAFGAPDTPDLGKWTAEISRMLMRYTADVKDKAFDIIVTGHRSRTFPSIAVIISACEDAAHIIAPSRPPEQFLKRNLDWTEAAITRADMLIQSQLGQRAADDGWVLSLWDFCRKHGRLPTGREVGECISNARGFDEAYAQVCRQGTPLDRTLEQLGASMLAKRREKAELAHGNPITPRPTRKDMAAGETPGETP